MNSFNRTAATSTAATSHEEPTSPFPLLRSAALVALALSFSACGQNPQSGTALTASQDAAIIGGTEATGKETFAPHIVALYDVSVGALCTASILSDTILVTAAHCVESQASELRVVFGTDISSKSIIVRPVDAYQVSPLWPFRQNQDENNGDIAIVKFSGGLPPGYSPIKFVTDISKLNDTMPVMLAGYGASNVVMTKDPRTGMSSPDHQNAGKLRYVTTSIIKARHTKSEILIDNSKGKGACHGDSGGPAYVDVNGEQVLIGVTSRGHNDNDDMCNDEVVYTGLQYYANWIVTTSKQLNSMTPRPVRAVAAAPAH